MQWFLNIFMLRTPKSHGGPLDRKNQSNKYHAYQYVGRYIGIFIYVFVNNFLAAIQVRLSVIPLATGDELIKFWKVKGQGQ